MVLKTLPALAALIGGCALTAGAAAEQHPVVAVVGPGRVQVEVRGLPLSLELAHLEVPEAQRADCQRRLEEAVKGKKAEVVYRPGFGVDAAGNGRVHLVVDGRDVAGVLLSAGVARFQAGTKEEGVFEAPLKVAQAKAEKAKAGLWAALGGAGAAVVKAPASAAAKKIERPRGPICALLDSPYWFAADSAEAAAADQARLIYYPDEAAAARAGKKAKPALDAAAASAPKDEAGADQVFARGKELYAQAIAKGNSPERDELYGQAFVVLSSALTTYSALAEARPDDEALAEKLRSCSQLRYGSIKQRRV
ncbi:MAG: hypothetical protein H0W72_15105 [Planctomycetes bacterium]|nr:hypothetical protein [Planctomycetota bacterium]